MTMDEVSAEAQRRGIVCTPVLRPEEVLANVYLLARGTFVDTELRRASPPEAAGFSAGRRASGPAPPRAGVGEHTDEALETRVTPRRCRSVDRAASLLPLAGLRVLDFGIGGVGVEAGRLFAEYGADVIRSRRGPTQTSSGSCRGRDVALVRVSSRSKPSFGVNAKDPEGFRSCTA